MFVVGVIGGGQLARMLQPAAIALGIELRVFAEAENSSAHQAVTMVGDYNKFELISEFAQGLDALTFDHEHVPVELLGKLVAAGVPVRPGPHALVHAQNKLVMRRRLEELALPQPKWAAASSLEEVQKFIDLNGPKIVVKTPIGGYDGKGVRVISAASEVSDWLEGLDDFGGELLLEEKVSFKREVAQLLARRPNGELQSWPLVATLQEHSVCAQVISPAPGPANFELARQIATEVAASLDVVGVMAVEMFETESGQLLINELAMRPHNSGHFSIEGSETSQFEQHLRAILDLPLGSTQARDEYTVMINLLGVDDQNNFLPNYPIAMSQFPEVKFHNYEKAPRKGRKMGHLTILGSDLESLISKGLACRDVLYKH